MNFDKLAKEIAVAWEHETATKHPLNQKVILEPGEKNLLGSVESQMKRMLPTIYKCIQDRLVKEKEEGIV